jgi:hypothetical protein
VAGRVNSRRWHYGDSVSHGNQFEAGAELPEMENTVVTRATTASAVTFSRVRKN